jgi:hypothetical protein
MHLPRRARRSLTLLLPALAVVAASCVTDARPSSCGEDDVTIQLVLTADELRPDDPAVCRDQDVTLVVDSATDGYLHIHGYDEAVPIIEVSAGSQETVEFVADRSGQFPIELHLGEDPSGVGLGIFTVHEP